jgi:hypothetical protein
MNAEIKSAGFLAEILLCTVLGTASVFADVIPPNSHYVQRCIKIAGLEQFPDIALVGAIAGPMITGYERSLIQPDACLSKGYKFNRFYIVWTMRAYLDSVGLADLDLASLLGSRKAAAAALPVGLLSDQIDPGSYYVPDDDPLVNEEKVYTLYLDGANAPALYLSQQTSQYNDGTPARMETFTLSVGGQAGQLAEADGKPLIMCSGVRLAYSVPQDGLVKIRISTITGQEVFRTDRDCRKAVMNLILLPQLPAGTYVVTLEQASVKTTKNVTIVQ